MRRSGYSRLLALLSCAALSFGLLACGPDYDRMDIGGVITSQPGGYVDRSRVDIPVGGVVKANLVAWNDRDERMKLSIRTLDPQLLEVAEVVYEDQYAFMGRRVGTTEIEVRADDDLVLIIQARVLASE